MFEIIISSDRAIQQAQKVIFKSSFVALHGVTYISLSLHPIKIDVTEQIMIFIIFFIANLNVFFFFFFLGGGVVCFFFFFFFFFLLLLFFCLFINYLKDILLALLEL